MEFIADLPVIGGFLSNALAFVVVLGIVVFVHEYGHYIVGRWCGIHAETFSLGFGPVVTSWHDRRGTKWQVAALPLGGYVKFLGDADGSSRADDESMATMSASDRARSFHGAHVGKRMATVAAGPFANFILSTVVFAGLILYQGVPTDEPVIGDIADVTGLSTPLEAGDRIRSVNGQGVATFSDLLTAVHEMPVPGPLTLLIERDGAEVEVVTDYLMPPLVADITPLSAASRADIKTGDLITAVNGTPIVAFSQLQKAVLAAADTEIVLTILRDGTAMDLPIKPRITESLLPDGTIDKKAMIGVSNRAIIHRLYEQKGPFQAVAMGAEGVVNVVDSSLTGIKHIVLGNLGFDNLQGPLGIAQISGQRATQGIITFIELIAVISTAIGMLNLFPIPVLDGGHLVMHAYEAVAGKPPAERFMRLAMTIGLGMVLLLMVFATYNDVMRLAIS